VMGLPGKVRRTLTEDERQGLRVYTNNYLEYKETYLEETAQAPAGPTRRT
jgi:carbonic anhydrase/acetyltransferase-like protein (isoleucine patch superfamily)